MKVRDEKSFSRELGKQSLPVCHYERLRFEATVFPLFPAISDDGSGLAPTGVSVLGHIELEAFVVC